jgi:hypothetical protein
MRWNMEVLELALLCASNIICVYIGTRLGQKVAKGEEIKLPTVNPLEAFKEHQNKKEAEMEQNRIDTILQNIESYDGTANGQKEVPRG